MVPRTVELPQKPGTAVILEDIIPSSCLQPLKIDRLMSPSSSSSTLGKRTEFSHIVFWTKPYDHSNLPTLWLRNDSEVCPTELHTVWNIVEKQLLPLDITVIWKHHIHANSLYGEVYIQQQKLTSEKKMMKKKNKAV